MTEQSTRQTTAPVTAEVTVALPPERAYELFTAGFDRWWPRSHHIGKAELRRAVMEPRDGGRWYEIGEDGSECDWGRVLVWDPPDRLVLAWQIDADWAYDPELVTEVELTFEAVADGHTLVRLEHRDLDRFGAKADAVRSAVGSGGGWPGILRGYADLADAA